MKERFINSTELTRLGVAPRLNTGAIASDAIDIFMAEPRTEVGAPQGHEPIRVNTYPPGTETAARAVIGSLDKERREALRRELRAVGGEQAAMRSGSKVSPERASEIWKEYRESTGYKITDEEIEYYSANGRLPLLDGGGSGEGEVEEDRRRSFEPSEELSTEGIPEGSVFDELQLLNAQLQLTDKSDVDRMDSILDSALDKVVHSDGDPAVKQLAQDRITERLRPLRENQVARQRVAANEVDPADRRKGLYRNRLLTIPEKELIKKAEYPPSAELEALFNRMFDNVDQSPSEEFSAAFEAGRQEHRDFMQVLSEEITRLRTPDKRTAEENDPANEESFWKNKVVILQQKSRRFHDEREAREKIHNAYFAIYSAQDTEGMNKYLAGFHSSWGDMAFGKAGVEQAMHFYEQALFQVKAENGGYLPNEEVVGHVKSLEDMSLSKEERNEKYVGRVLTLTQKNLEKANAAGMFGRTLEPWELDRAVSFARGMMVITGRTIEIAATSYLPSSVNKESGAFIDQFANKILQELFPFRHVYKFNTRSAAYKVLAYLMNRKKGKPYDTKELEEFAHIAEKGEEWEVMNILNGLVPDSEARLYSKLNPFQIGSLLSRSGWRIGGDPDKVGITVVAPLMANGKSEWIGTGIEVERLRGKSEEELREVFIKMNNRTPLRLFLHDTKIREAVLEKMKITMMDPKMQEAINELTILQEKLIQEGVEGGNAKSGLKVIPKTDGGKALQNAINEVLNGKYFDYLAKQVKEQGWKYPFVYGTDDVPYSKYDFQTTGPRTFARRWADMGGAVAAGKGLGAYLNALEGGHVDTPEQMTQLVHKMHDIYFGIRNYNEEYAEEFIKDLAIGTSFFFKKGWQYRLPAGIGTAVGLVTGKRSYAQIAFGRGAGAWDELQINEFLRLVRADGIMKEKHQKEAQELVGGNKIDVVRAFLRTAIPLFGLAFLVYLLSTLRKGGKSGGGH